MENDSDDTELDEPVTGENDDLGTDVDSDDRVSGPVADTPDDTDDSGGASDDDGNDDDDDAWDDLLVKIARDTATTKTLAAIAVGVLIIGMTALGFLVRANNDNNSRATPIAASGSTTSTTEAMASVADQPCVALVDPLPAGAPPMDIVVGPAPTSLVVKDIKEGTGATVAANDTVNVNYVVAACSTGKIVDSSYKSGTSTPSPISLASVIPGFAQGVTGMKVGGQRLIGIPSDQAFGAQGRPPTIAPDEAIWFVVDLVSTAPTTGTP